MIDKELDELEALLAKTSPKPWVLMYSRHSGGGATVQISDSADHTNESAIVHWMGFDAGDKTWKQKIANAALIVALRNAAPDLIASARREQKLREVLEQAFNLYNEEHDEFAPELWRSALEETK
ncbi:MAG TPA: hypothetical protein VII92_02935 [Anaerolineae bacterium]